MSDLSEHSSDETNTHSGITGPIVPFPNTSAPALLRLPVPHTCVDKTTKIITEFTRKDPFLHVDC